MSDEGAPLPSSPPREAAASSLDPGAVAPEAPEAAAPSGGPPEDLPPPPPTAQRRAARWLLVGALSLGLLQIPLALTGRRVGSARAAASQTPAASRPLASASAVASASVSASAPPPTTVALVDPDAGPPPFRLASLESDPTVGGSLEAITVKVGKRTCGQALEAVGVSKGDVLKLAAALAKVRKLDVCHPQDRLVVLWNKADHALRGFELEWTPGDIVRAFDPALPVPVHEPLAGGLDAGVDAETGGPATTSPLAFKVEHVVLPVSHRRHAVALVVGADLAASIKEAGLDPTLVDELDDAFATRSDLPAPTKGSILRVVADATYVAGRFDRYDELVAFDYGPRPGLPSVRLYHTRDPKLAVKSHGWFDGKGHQPLRGKWRMPVAFPRITSRFNPKRLHPILKVVTPHNGCDFGAPPGTPVYSIGAGIVSFRGDAGPSGNLVSVLHEGGIESGYAHLSRFAPGIVPGTHVEARTLIGYVGSTGRSTGPHLHLSVKKNGMFIDPLTLKMDATRVVPPAERDAFGKRKAEADFALDAIPWPKADAPAAPAVPPPGPSGSASAGEGEELDH